jgi:hypothetical protein
MDDNRRDELDLLVEGALREWGSGEAAPARVWDNITLGLQERSRRTPTKSHRVRELCLDAWYWGVDALASARIILTPSLRGAEDGWTDRLVLVGNSHGSYRLSIHY